MPRRNVTVGDKIALLEKIKNQPPNTSHGQLAQLNGVPKSTLHVLYKVIPESSRTRSKKNAGLTYSILAATSFKIVP
jgi:hypothetical protein